MSINETELLERGMPSGTLARNGLPPFGMLNQAATVQLMPLNLMK
ncbi:MAG: hypothetical protein WCS87_07270 [Methylococcaceae bacterium]